MKCKDKISGQFYHSIQTTVIYIRTCSHLPGGVYVGYNLDSLDKQIFQGHMTCDGQDFATDSDVLCLHY